MDIHFNHTAAADAPAEALFDVITDYASYPSFSREIAAMTIVRRDENGAEFVADRTTRIGRRVRAFDRYLRHGDLVVERTYDGNATARSTWIIHPVDGSRCTLTIDASQRMGFLRGLVMKPLLRRIFFRLNFDPFIREAERRAGLAAA